MFIIHLVVALIALAFTAEARADCTPQGGVAAEFKKETDYRGMVTGAVSAVPKVGGAISFVIKLFWEDDSQANLFNQMKAYVDKVVPALIAEERQKEEKLDINGLRANMRDYQNTNDRSEKGTKLLILISALDREAPHFYDRDNPEKMLPLLVAFGSLHIAALQEQRVHLADYFGHESDHDRCYN